MPLGAMVLIPVLFDPETPAYKKRYLWTILIVIGIFLVVFIATIVMWGSFPIEHENDGSRYLRIVPFFPWPNRPFLGFPGLQ